MRGVTEEEWWRGGVVAWCLLSSHKGDVKEEERLNARPTNI